MKNIDIHEIKKTKKVKLKKSKFAKRCNIIRKEVSNFIMSIV